MDDSDQKQIVAIGLNGNIRHFMSEILYVKKTFVWEERNENKFPPYFQPSYKLVNVIYKELRENTVCPISIFFLINMFKKTKVFSNLFSLFQEVFLLTHLLVKSLKNFCIVVPQQLLFFSCNTVNTCITIIKQKLSLDDCVPYSYTQFTVVQYRLAFQGRISKRYLQTSVISS